jgi:hypothetical protein
LRRDLASGIVASLFGFANSNARQGAPARFAQLYAGEPRGSRLIALTRDLRLKQYRPTPEGVRDEFSTSHPAGSVKRLAHTETNQVLTLSILGRPFLQGHGVFVKVLHDESGTCYELELARAPDGWIGRLSKRPDET